MTQTSQRKLRVLIVDNRREHRENFAELVAFWGHQPIVAYGHGQRLLEQARELAQTHRCQIALVDMRLIDDQDVSDRSGIELVPTLWPTRVIMLSAQGTIRAARDAISDYGAASFLEKAEGPEILEQQLKRLAHELRLDDSGPVLNWPAHLDSPTLRDVMFPGRWDIPADQADDLLRRLFADRQRVDLELITEDSPVPASDTKRPAGPGNTLRRESRVFTARVDGEPALQVVKLARIGKIQAEVANYKAFVATGLGSQRRPEMIGHVLLWDMGVVAYRLVGNGGLSRARAQIFRRFYWRTSDVGAILKPIIDFFNPQAWGNWYSNRLEELQGNLVDAYDESWEGGLSRNYQHWETQSASRRFGKFPLELPNPGYWLARHRHRCRGLPRLRRAITHGDLHGDNFFVEAAYAWPIDFERTGYGPLLRDFVELIQDLTTRIARFNDDDLTLVYELAQAICGPEHPDQPMFATAAIKANPEANKLFEVVQRLQLLAAERTCYEDRREYLWGLLCNNLFVASKLQAESPRWLRTMLFAAVICVRLEHWSAKPVYGE